VLLIVDDEEEQVRGLKALLRGEYRVLTAGSAREGLGVLERERVQLILSDQRMPDMTGAEFLALAREQQPEAVRILCTGFVDAEDAIAAINEGHVFRYVTKPVNVGELKATLKEACERYDLVEERKKLLVQLQMKNEELERANELKTNFIRVASHELRTPLTILLGLARLMGMEEGVPAGVKDRVGRIRSAAERLQYLVDQLIAMLSAGRFEAELERKPADMTVLLRQAGEDVRPFVELRKQELVVEVAEGLGMMRVDPEKIRDLVNHLLLNAVKFTKDGGRVVLRGEKVGGGVRIVVVDTGVGMSEEHLRHLFEPFYTGEDVSRHASGMYEFGRQGIGLGLSVVKAFVEMHGGRISVTSEVGVGTRVEIVLGGLGTTLNTQH
jgi:signal transduction histidine kinase